MHLSKLTQEAHQMHTLLWTLHLTASSVTKTQVWDFNQSPPSSSLLPCQQLCCLWLRQQLGEQQVTSVCDFINLYFHLSLSSTPDHFLLLYTCSATGQPVLPSCFFRKRPWLFPYACLWFDFSICSPPFLCNFSQLCNPSIFHTYILELSSS